MFTKPGFLDLDSEPNNDTDTDSNTGANGDTQSFAASANRVDVEPANASSINKTTSFGVSVSGKTKTPVVVNDAKDLGAMGNCDNWNSRGESGGASTRGSAVSNGKRALLAVAKMYVNQAEYRSS
jgi:hypothetical protein